MVIADLNSTVVNVISCCLLSSFVQQREWKKRWEHYPKNLAIALAKYHAIVLVMRLYEYIAEKFVDEVTLDKLTMDTFDSAKRSSRQGRSGANLGREMLGTCWRANFIAYLADYSVHQMILVFGYYVYIRESRQARKNRRIKEESEEDDDKDMKENGPLILSFVRKSTLLALSRGVGLAFASVGGAIGSTITPGWGTLVGTNLGDGFAITLTDDMMGSSISA